MSLARTLLAFAAAPLAASLVIAIGFARFAEDPLAFVIMLVLTGMVSLVFTLPAAVIGGVPVFLVLRRLRWDTLAGFTVAGLVLGALAGAVALLTGGTPDVEATGAEMLPLLTAAAGAAGGAIFSLVRGRRSDRPGVPA